MNKISSVWGIAALLAGASLSPAVLAQEQPSAEVLPTAQQERFLAQVGRGLDESEAAQLSVRVDDGSTTPAERPFQAVSELLILLDPQLAPAEIMAALREHSLRLTKTMPQIGAIVVNVANRLSADAGETVRVDQLGDLSLAKIAEELMADRRFVAVTPNVAMSPFHLQAGPATEDPAAAAVGERTDWGIGDTKFDRVWPLMNQPFLVGVIDVGFADHEDLDTAPGLAQIIPVNDHGNHVAGIMCAKHNSIGVRGALKNCRVTIASAALIPDSAEVEQPGLGIATALGAYIDSTLEFIDANPNARVVNLSLGYNWRRNYRIDPREPGHEAQRDAVKIQGQFFRTVLAFAKRRNVALVSAAGNDSVPNDTPLPASLASPFNMGSQMIRETDGWSNALVVQAHDSNAVRASFSNGGADISCPGVDVLSALASSRNAYGPNSGTSMAAPYCAAGLSALRALRPELTLRQAIECLMSGPDRVDGVPKLDMDFAVNRCRR